MNLMQKYDLLKKYPVYGVVHLYPGEVNRSPIKNQDAYDEHVKKIRRIAKNYGR